MTNEQSAHELITPKSTEDYTMSDTDKIKIELGETIKEHPKGGPVVARLTVAEPRRQSRVVEVTVSNLRKAAITDLEDSYDDVYVWSNGIRVALTDHKRPIGGDDARKLDDFTESVVRTDVVDAGEDARRSLISRDAIDDALEQFDDDEEVEVMVADNYPVVFRNTDDIVGIAPIASSTQLPSEEGISL